jgi:GAF domain-containing protein
MPIDPRALQRSVDALMAGVGAGGPAAPVADGLRALITAAEQILDVSCVGILMLDEHDVLRSVATSGPAAAALEEAQQQLGSGPGVDTLRTASTVTVPDLRAVDRYAELAGQVADRGVRAVVSAPVRVTGAVVGNLNAIHLSVHEWTPEEITAVEAYAQVVGTLLEINTAGAAPGRSPRGGPAPPSPDGTAER